jgi:hypothetical protein
LYKKKILWSQFGWSPRFRKISSAPVHQCQGTGGSGSQPVGVGAPLEAGRQPEGAGVPGGAGRQLEGAVDPGGSRSSPEEALDVGGARSPHEEARGARIQQIPAKLCKLISQNKSGGWPPLHSLSGKLLLYNSSKHFCKIYFSKPTKQNEETVGIFVRIV